MSNYCIELTLDLNDQTCNNSSLVLLPLDGSPVPKWFSELKMGDSIFFKLSDVTTPWVDTRKPTKAHIGVTPISPSFPDAYPFKERLPTAEISLNEEHPPVSYVTPTSEHVYRFDMPLCEVGTSNIRFNLTVQILDADGQPMSQHDPEIFIGPGS